MVQKTVEGSKLVILIRKFYPCEKNIVNDTLKFEKVISHDKLLNQAIHMENRVTDVLKNVRDKKKKKKKNSNEQYKDLSSSVPRPGVKYGLA